MLECIVLGDSIASGVGQARPECETVARVGITSGAYINDLFPLASHTARTAVISLGVNDDGSVDTIDNLRRVRGSLSVGSAVWLLPNLKENVRAAIRTVAAEYGDQLVDTRPYVGPDHLHPTGTGYRTLAGQTAGGETEVAFAPAPLPPDVRERINRREEGPPAFAMGGNLARYRLHVVFRGKLQQMADLRLQLAQQQAGHQQGGRGQAGYARWPSTDVTYGALPPPSLAYGAFPTLLPSGSTSLNSAGLNSTGSNSGGLTAR